MEISPVEKKHIILGLRTTLIVGLTFLVAGSVFASAWQDNSNLPTQQNANAPIHTGAVDQEKLVTFAGSPPTAFGNLTIDANLNAKGGFRSTLLAVFDQTIQIKGGCTTSCDKKVLTSDASGNASWQRTGGGTPSVTYLPGSGNVTATFCALTGSGNDGTKSQSSTCLVSNNGDGTWKITQGKYALGCQMTCLTW